MQKNLTKVLSLSRLSTTSKISIVPHFLICCLFLFTSCFKVSKTIEPQVSFATSTHYLNSLPSPFPPLSSSETQTSWGTEYKIALAFTKECDLYRAISTFKRALILVPVSQTERRLEIEYAVLYTYYLAKKYDEVITFFNTSSLRDVDNSFVAYDDLLVMLFEAYSNLKEDAKARYINSLLNQTNPELSGKLTLSSALLAADMTTLCTLSHDHSLSPAVDNILACYNKNKKSIRTAQGLNALLPGAGYLYVGQKQSAITAALLNGLFIAAAYHFFHNGHTAAGIITTSFELGWYFGGIYGAAESAKLYNERLYERLAYPVLRQNNLFPILLLKYAF